MKDSLVPRATLLGSAAAQLAALAAQGDLFLQDFQKPRVGPRLLDEIAYAVLHRLYREAHGSQAGHHHDRRCLFHLFEVAKDVKALPAGLGIPWAIEVHENYIEFPP